MVQVSVVDGGSGHTIIAPDLAKANAGFRNITEQVMMWSTDVG